MKWITHSTAAKMACFVVMASAILFLANSAGGAAPVDIGISNRQSVAEFARIATQNLHARGFTNFTEADLRRDPSIWITNMFRASADLALMDTNLLVFRGETRAGAVIFVDECLSRGITNALSEVELRSWATNIIARYARTRGTQVAPSDIPPQLQNLSRKIPACIYSYADTTNAYFHMGPDSNPPSFVILRSASGQVEAVTISWYIYGIVVGQDSFEWQGKPWYRRKLGEGIYLWHGYK